VVKTTFNGEVLAIGCVSLGVRARAGQGVSRGGGSTSTAARGGSSPSVGWCTASNSDTGQSGSSKARAGDVCAQSRFEVAVTVCVHSIDTPSVVGAGVNAASQVLCTDGGQVTALVVESALNCEVFPVGDIGLVVRTRAGQAQADGGDIIRVRVVRKTITSTTEFARISCADHVAVANIGSIGAGDAVSTVALPRVLSAEVLVGRAV
jgi:hypothetical protein